MSKSAKNSKPIINRKVFDDVLSIVLIVFTVIAFAVSGVLFYQRKYLTPFWVNGQSMYPTLNKDAKHYDGTEYGVNGGGIYGEGAKDVDYGVMDEHDAAKKKIKRFDIVVCSYSEIDSSDKIKRVLGLPGETIKFDASLTENRGDLYVKQNDGSYAVVDQPIEKECINSLLAYYPTQEIVLDENEYFVAGDNRAHSNDCRGNLGREPFPIKYEWILGKVIAIVGKCEAYRVSDGYDIKNVDYDFWPRFM